jgi:integrase
LDNRCGTFSKSFSCNIGNVNDTDISGWLRGLDVSGRTRNNYRMAIISLFKFAVAQGYIPKDHLDSDKIASAKKRTGAIEIFSPNQIAALLAGADDETRPFIALGAFAGLRSSEIERLDWSNIDLQRNYVTVHAHKGTAQRRLVPILTNLREWLLPIAKPQGQFWRFKNTQKPIARLTKKTGIPWKTNALRHSFISYRVAQIQNVAQVALECGNSPQMIFRNYRELVKPSDAESWFAIAPVKSENIIALAAAAV